MFGASDAWSLTLNTSAKHIYPPQNINLASKLIRITGDRVKHWINLKTKFYVSWFNTIFSHF